ncbi:MAG TPA: V-type ATPase subunit [Spirochaetia bacterium]|nr:V-type ATPase subunit [Spirochaetia bacterium]
MAEYDYLNARVRAMGADLLPNVFFEQLLSLDSEELPMDALLASPFGAALREGLAHAAGIAAVEWALRQDLARSFAKVRKMTPPGARGLLDTQLARWDIQNVLAVLRGMEKKATAAEISAALLPAGAFPEPQLMELARSPDPVSLARKLATWNYPFAFELHHALIERHGARFDLARAEMRLYRAYYAWALGRDSPDRESQRVVRKLLTEQIDLANIRTALDAVRRRAVDAGRAADAGHTADTPEAAPPPSPIPGGRLPRKFLRRLAGCATLEEAFSAIDESYFAPGIEKGILAYGESRSLGVMERYLEEVVIQAGCRLYRSDLLDISVPIGYLWRKLNQTVNLRALCRGRHARIPANAIRKELLLV